jgi:hypothetical protein
MFTDVEYHLAMVVRQFEILDQLSRNHSVFEAVASIRALTVFQFELTVVCAA